jgi:hypothetical protein
MAEPLVDVDDGLLKLLKTLRPLALTLRIGDA